MNLLWVVVTTVQVPVKAHVMELVEQDASLHVIMDAIPIVYTTTNKFLLMLGVTNNTPNI